jgi:putative (di)nucleoside polyphosphate hydrolase
MIDRTNLKYRKSTCAMVIDNNNKVLIIQKLNWKESDWDFPGGGIDFGEVASKTILRELNEELGSNLFEILKESNLVDRYEWPDEVIEMRRITKKENYRGQERAQFLVKFNGDQKDLNIQKSEIQNHKWVNINELEKYFIFPNQWNKTNNLLKEFEINWK